MPSLLGPRKIIVFSVCIGFIAVIMNLIHTRIMLERSKKRPRLVYSVEWSSIHQAMRSELQEKFIQLDAKDEDTQAFLASCISDYSLLKELAASLLRTIGRMSVTDANAYTNKGSMFVFSLSQLETLVPMISRKKRENGEEELSLLDVGAGDGTITARIARRFSRVVVTERSSPMLEKLKKYGWEALQPEDLPAQEEAFDMVMCLNVLDRADKPVSLLKTVRNLLKVDGRLIIAVVLPWCPFVSSGRSKLQPTEKLPIRRACVRKTSFEDSLSNFIKAAIIPNGFEIERWSRVPYISQGNRKSAYFVLSDAILVLKRAGPSSQHAAAH